MTEATFQVNNLKAPLDRKSLPWPKWFAFSAGIILLVTGMAKLISSLGSAEVLGQMDPLLKISFRHLLFAVGLLELAVSTSCLLFLKPKLSLMLVAWLSTNFLAYRIGLVLIDYHKPCSCMGTLTDAIHLPPSLADLMMKSIMIYLVIGSYLSLHLLGKKAASLEYQS